MKNAIFLNAATKIGYKICRDAIWDNDRCYWLSPNVEDINGYPKTYFQALGNDFYGGTTGIAFFLTALYEAQPDEIFRETVMAAFRQAASQLPKIIDTAQLGFHTGISGFAFVAMYMGEVFDNENYTKIALAEIEKLTQINIATSGIDVIDGCAGALPVLILIQKKHPSENLKNFITAIGKHLVEIAEKKEIGWSWNTIGQQGNNLTGYAHGVAGIGTALLEMQIFTKDNQYLEAAMQGFAYENHFFSLKHQNWPDFRSFAQQPNSEPSYACGWCHGAPGIGLARLRAYEITKNESYRKDAEIAIQTTLKHNSFEQISNFSLCHGLFGNAELLLYGSEILQENNLRKSAESIAEFGIKCFLDEQTPFPNGLNNPFDSPDFMLGSAGMGYFYLRLFDSKRFKSVLISGS